MKLNLKRVLDNGDETFGVLHDGDTPICLTLERPYLDNTPYTSCIPIGTYLCVRVDSHKFGDTFEVKDVTGRTHILFHKGNKVSNSVGCILLGAEWEDDCIKGGRSKDGFDKFWNYTKDVHSFLLEIS